MVSESSSPRRPTTSRQTPVSEDRHGEERERSDRASDREVEGALDAVAVAAHAERAARVSLATAIDRALDAGATWAQVAEAAGISKLLAQSRYGASRVVVLDDEGWLRVAEVLNEKVRALGAPHERVAQQVGVSDHTFRQLRRARQSSYLPATIAAVATTFGWPGDWPARVAAGARLADLEPGGAT